MVLAIKRQFVQDSVSGFFDDAGIDHGFERQRSTPAFTTRSSARLDRSNTLLADLPSNCGFERGFAGLFTPSAVSYRR